MEYIVNGMKLVLPNDSYPVMVDMRTIPSFNKDKRYNLMLIYHDHDKRVISAYYDETSLLDRLSNSYRHDRETYDSYVRQIDELLGCTEDEEEE